MPSPLDLAKAIEPELVELRRDFHRHPEIAFEEVRTGGIVGDQCEKIGLNVRRGCAKTGVVATLNSDKPGPAIALRADMDALPIHEENEVAYRSTLQGKGHLCGHDAHTTMLLGAAKILTKYKDKIPFPVRFLFQPAEEIPRGGAEKLIAEGHLEGVNEVFGLHVNPMLPTGTLGTHVGPTMACMDQVEIEVEGLGGHGAMPNQCLDPVLCSAEIIMGLQSIVSRRVDPLEPAVLSICQINAGNAFNVIPNKVKMIGTARSLSKGLRDKLPGWIDDIASGIAKSHGQRAKTVYIKGTTVLVNTKDETDKIGKAFEAIGGKAQDIKPTMGGEDFSYYLEKVPGSFAFLGAGDGTPSTSQCFHHPRYNIDEKAMPWGAAVFVQLVLDRAGVKA